LETDFCKIVACVFLKILKSSADRESKTVPLAGQEEIGQFFGKSYLRVRIEIINQAKRNIDDRHLNAQFQTDARLEIADVGKVAFADAHQLIRLRLAAQKDLLPAERKRDRASRRK
jgi:hypothetical protein